MLSNLNRCSFCSFDILLDVDVDVADDLVNDKYESGDAVCFWPYGIMDWWDVEWV